ncbi:hypothetical protein [Streptomyces sp. N2A]|uniref:hypothetical protein n=1 Tax=Streptomyces sp. N2A TaxID=3073936 RepID=UPI0028708CAC|nr:hypothetical protein [Streptomyces sp. N2A]
MSSPAPHRAQARPGPYGGRPRPPRSEAKVRELQKTSEARGRGPAPALLVAHLRAALAAAPTTRLGIRDRAIVLVGAQLIADQGAVGSSLSAVGSTTRSSWAVPECLSRQDAMLERLRVHRQLEEA